MIHITQPDPKIARRWHFELQDVSLSPSSHLQNNSYTWVPPDDGDVSKLNATIVSCADLLISNHTHIKSQPPLCLDYKAQN